MELEDFLRNLKRTADAFHMTQPQQQEWTEFLQKDLENPKWDPENLPRAPKPCPQPAHQATAPNVPALVLTRHQKRRKGGQRKLGCCSKRRQKDIRDYLRDDLAQHHPFNVWNIANGKFSRINEEVIIETTDVLATNFSLNMDGTLPAEVKKILKK